MPWIGGGGDTASLDTRITALEDKYVVLEIYESKTTTTGTITIPTGAEILLDRYEEAGDALCLQLDSNGIPIDAVARDATGAAVSVSSFDTGGNYVLSGLPVPTPFGIVYQIRVQQKNLQNVTQASILNRTQQIDTKDVDNVNAKYTIPNTLDEALTVIHDDTIFGNMTGIRYSNGVSVNADDTKFDVGETLAEFFDYTTDIKNPTRTTALYAGATAITPVGLGVTAITFLYIDQTGTLQQQLTPISSTERRTKAVLGFVYHPGANILRAKLASVSTADTDNLAIDIIDSIGGTVRKSGLAYYPTSGTLQINHEAGVITGVGANDDNPTDRNNEPVLQETNITFIQLYRSQPDGGGGCIQSLQTNIDTANYDPNGDGTLVPIPAGYWVIHRIVYEPRAGLTGVQYAQNAYDSEKKAIDNFDKEDFIYCQEVDSAVFVTYLFIQQGMTNLDNAEFVLAGCLAKCSGISGLDSTIFAENIEIIDGMSYQRQVITFVEETGTIYAEIEREGGGDLTYVFGQKEYTLNCTTGAGTGGKARVALTAGGDSSPQRNIVYVTPNGNLTVNLLSGIVNPAGEYGEVCTVLIPSVARFLTRDMYGSRRWTNAKEVGGRGVLTTVLENLRDPSKYKSGLNPVFSIDTLPTPDSMNVTVGSGVVKELYLQATDALDLSVDSALVVNDEISAYSIISDLNEITTDALGNTLLSNNTYYQLLVAISTNTNGKTQLLIKKPKGSYLTASGAFNDTNGYTDTSFPKDFDTVHLVGALVIRYQTTSGGTYTNAALGFGVSFIDLRESSPGVSAGGSGAAAVTEFSDAAFRVFNDIDGTKETGFNAADVPTGTTFLFNPINPTIPGDVIIQGDLTVNGTTTTINTEVLDVEDKNITLGKVTTPSDITANGGGFTLKGTTDKTFIWDSVDSNFTLSEHMNIASGKSYKINNQDINTAGVLTNVAYLNQENVFSATQSITAPIGLNLNATAATSQEAFIYKNSLDNNVVVSGKSGEEGYVLVANNTGVPQSFLYTGYNYFNAKTGIGTVSDAAITHKLTVVGDAKITEDATFSANVGIGRVAGTESLEVESNILASLTIDTVDIESYDKSVQKFDIDDSVSGGSLVYDSVNGIQLVLTGGFVFSARLQFGKSEKILKNGWQGSVDAYTYNVSSTAQIQTSPDGITWTTQASKTSGTPSHLVWTPASPITEDLFVRIQLIDGTGVAGNRCRLRSAYITDIYTSKRVVGLGDSIVSNRGFIGIGKGNTTPTKQLDILFDDDADLAGAIFRNSDGSIGLLNGTGGTDSFAPFYKNELRGTSSSAYFSSNTRSGEDTGTQPINVIRALVNNGAVGTRPLLQIQNFTSPVSTVKASGVWEIFPSSTVGAKAPAALTVNHNGANAAIGVNMETYPGTWDKLDDTYPSSHMAWDVDGSGYPNGIITWYGSDASNTSPLQRITMSLTKEGKLSVTDDIQTETGKVILKETTTPTAIADYGKIYTKSDNKLYFQDGSGVEHEIAFV